MNILGIHDGHTATACLISNGEVLHNISEERFTKKKGQGGFPVKAVEYILRTSNLSSSELDYIGLVGHVKPLTSILQYEEGRQSIFPRLVKHIPVNPRLLIKQYVNNAQKKRLKDASLLKNINKLGLPIDKVKVVEHHQTHAAAAYYTSKFYQNSTKTLVFTLDGSGDGLAGTVSVVDDKGHWERLKEISTFDSLGVVYGRATQLLAMKPWEHEYKLSLIHI